MSIYGAAKYGSSLYGPAIPGACWVSLCQALVLLHGPLLAAFEAAGGHPLAAQALYDAIASEPSRQALSWLSDEILAIFSAALTPGK